MNAGESMVPPRAHSFFAWLRLAVLGLRANESPSGRECLVTELPHTRALGVSTVAGGD